MYINRDGTEASSNGYFGSRDHGEDIFIENKSPTTALIAKELGIHWYIRDRIRVHALILFYRIRRALKSWTANRS